MSRKTRPCPRDVAICILQPPTASRCLIMTSCFWVKIFLLQMVQFVQFGIGPAKHDAGKDSLDWVATIHSWVEAEDALSNCSHRTAACSIFGKLYFQTFQRKISAFGNLYTCPLYNLMEQQVEYLPWVSWRRLWGWWLWCKGQRRRTWRYRWDLRLYTRAEREREREEGEETWDYWEWGGIRWCFPQSGALDNASGAGKGREHLASCKDANGKELE